MGAVFGWRYASHAFEQFAKMRGVVIADRRGHGLNGSSLSRMAFAVSIRTARK
jgi:hypothetical protein